MSRGTPITTLRISPALLDRIDAAIIAANTRRRDEPYTRTSWIIHAITEKLDKLERGRSRMGRVASEWAARLAILASQGSSAEVADSEEGAEGAAGEPSESAGPGKK